MGRLQVHKSWATKNMDRSSMMFVLFFLFLGLNLELSEAACNENGCCYCNLVTGQLWPGGQYCNYGRFCRCHYSSFGHPHNYFGLCYNPVIGIPAIQTQNRNSCSGSN